MEQKQETVKPTRFLFSTRFGLAVLACFGFVNLYTMRVDMSVAIVCMVNKSAEVSGESNDSARAELERKCNVDSKNNDLGDGEFLWDKSLQSLILGSFFWGYILTQIPGGILAGYIGGKRVFGWSIFLCSVVTVVTPVAARASPYLLIACRVLTGIAQGVVWPAMWTMWAEWAPPMERSRLISFSAAGAQLGNVITFPLAGFLCDKGFDGGWPSIFYILGICGVVWFVLWMLLTADKPADHKRISEDERRYIISSLQGQGVRRNTKYRVPLLAIAKSPAVWAIIVAHTCNNWGGYTMLTNIPTYMREVLFFDIKSNGLLSALPYIAYWLVIVIGGNVADVLRTRAGLSTTVVRKIFNSGQAVCAVFILAVGFMTCEQRSVAVALLVLGVSASGLQSSAGYVVNHVDIAPRYAGFLFGVSNTFASAPGFLAPLTVGQLTPNQTQQDWQKVFYITAAIYTFGTIFFIIFASGELQDWAKFEDDEEVAETKKDSEMREIEHEGKSKGENGADGKMGYTGPGYVENDARL